MHHPLHLAIQIPPKTQAEMVWWELATRKELLLLEQNQLPVEVKNRLLGLAVLMQHDRLTATMH